MQLMIWSKSIYFINYACLKRFYAAFDADILYFVENDTHNFDSIKHSKQKSTKKAITKKNHLVIFFFLYLSFTPPESTSLCKYIWTVEYWN